MGRNISVMGGAGAGQRTEHRTDNRHWFAIDWTSAIKTEGYKERREGKGGERDYMS